MTLGCDALVRESKKNRGLEPPLILDGRILVFFLEGFTGRVAHD